MMNPHEFAPIQLELTAKFTQYDVDHPKVDSLLPEQSFVYFHVAGEDEFNRYSRELAERHRSEEGMPIVCVHIQGLAPPQGSRLIDPVIQSEPAMA